MPLSAPSAGKREAGVVRAKSTLLLATGSAVRKGVGGPSTVQQPATATPRGSSMNSGTNSPTFGAAVGVPLAFLQRNRRAAAAKSSLYTRSIKDLVYMDFAIGSKYAGRVLIGLYTDAVPLSAENFIQLCQGFKVHDKILGYRNTQVHKVQQGVAMLAGDVLTGCGGEGLSIYGKK
ncbi:photosynthetic NDH subunit of lumenal location 5, chloroplastic-like [Cyclospora cayetanensis]|uniref:Photosynthetic NDH subunit of lumenal location 5, chloroplastic-like n=1 Tax=Cyclospora cayetanensis TaxID=88456 RepID=A0A6P6S3X5_9EIME|nr:photosynthetic NDH subunit of lumenal location 5, chloroplastic-like [Cyclospora cayetanensis]